MIKVVSEATFIGMITLILGKIIIELLVKEDINNKNYIIKKPKGVYCAFFLTGFILHIIIEYYNYLLIIMGRARVIVIINDDI